MKKAQGLSLNVIIVAILAILVLVVLVAVFIGKFTQQEKVMESCAPKGGHCTTDVCNYDSEVEVGLKCPVNEVSQEQRCCINKRLASTLNID